jgi:hypothetical protein
MALVEMLIGKENCNATDHQPSGEEVDVTARAAQIIEMHV